jgi:hypothetical protein
VEEFPWQLDDRGFRAEDQARRENAKNSKWNITPETGRKGVFTGRLLKTFNIGKTPIAIFSVRKSKV